MQHHELPTRGTSAIAVASVGQAHPMSGDKAAVYSQAIDRLREVESLLEGSEAGICLIHLDACIAALESRVKVVKGIHPLKDASL